MILARKPCFKVEQSTCNPPLRLVRRMHGSAQSLLVSDVDDSYWIIKLRSELQGPNALANELLGSYLCRALGLPIPEMKQINVSRSFLDDRRTWFQTPAGNQRPAEGIHFASKYFPESTGQEVIGFLPPMLRSLLKNRDDCLGIFLFDIWAMHTDFREALFFADQGSMRMTFIDHGHLFGGPDWSTKQPFIGDGMLQRFAVQDAAREGRLDIWINRMQRILPSALEASIKRIPAPWYVGEIGALKGILLKRLLCLPKLASEALHSARVKVETMRVSEERSADSPIRLLSKGGAEHWL